MPLYYDPGVGKEREKRKKGPKRKEGEEGKS